MADTDAIATLAEALVGELIERGNTVATAESCTGGWIAKALTDISGSSQCFGYGIVSYSNAAKESLLGVSGETLRAEGAVSEAVAAEMAAGALARSNADLAVAVSGIAGPDGGSEEKPVGTVCFAWKPAGGPAVTETRRLNGDRDAIRGQSVLHALQRLREELRGIG